MYGARVCVCVMCTCVLGLQCVWRELEPTGQNIKTEVCGDVIFSPHVVSHVVFMALTHLFFTNIQVCVNFGWGLYTCTLPHN